MQPLLDTKTLYDIACNGMCSCRRFFAAAVNRVDVAALVRSRATHVQLSALRASNTLAHTPDALTASILPCIIELLAVPGGNLRSEVYLTVQLQLYISTSFVNADASHIAADTLHTLAVPCSPTRVWQAVQGQISCVLSNVSLATL